MTSPIHQFVTRLIKSNVFGRAVEYLPEEVRDALQYFATDEKPSLIGRGPLSEGDTVQGVAVFLGQVRQGAALRGVNLMKGTIVGGTVRGCNVGLGEVAGGDVRGVNVLIGDVRGGTVRGINMLAGDVHGGSIEGANVVVGDLHAGKVTKANLVVGDIHGGKLDVNILLGMGHSSAGLSPSAKCLLTQSPFVSEFS